MPPKPPKIYIGGAPVVRLPTMPNTVHAARPSSTLDSLGAPNPPGLTDLEYPSDTGGISLLTPPPGPVSELDPARMIYSQLPGLTVSPPNLEKDIELIFKADQAKIMLQISRDLRWTTVYQCVEEHLRTSYARILVPTQLEAMLEKCRQAVSSPAGVYYFEHWQLTHPQRPVEEMLDDLSTLTPWPCFTAAVEAQIRGYRFTQRHEALMTEALRQEPPRGISVHIYNQTLRDPRYKLPTDDLTIMEIQIHNLKQCLYHDSLFTHRELAEQIAPLCDDFRIDTTIVTQPLYGYDHVKKIWRRGVDINQLEDWIDGRIKTMIEHEIPLIKKQIPDLKASLPPKIKNQNGQELNKTKRDAIQEQIKALENTVGMLEFRLKAMGGKHWASNVAACLMPKLYNLSNMEQVAQGVTQPIFGLRIEAHRHLFALQDNKVLDLQTLEIRDRERHHYCTLISGVRYDPEASPIQFEQFITQIMCHVTEMVNFLAESICYTMSGDMILELFFMCIGRPDCGKTSLFEIMDAFFGEYQYEVPKSLYLHDKHPRTGPDPTMLGTQHKRFGATAELGPHDIFDNQKMNALSTGQKVTVKAMYALENQSFKPSMKPWFHTNYIPKMHLDEALIKRFIYFPMNHKFSKTPNLENQETESLIEKGYHRRFLTPEGLSGLLNYLIPHFRRFNARNKNLPPIPQMMSDAIQEEVKARDTFQAWIDQCCDVTDPTGKIETHAALNNYNLWATDLSRKGKVKTYTTINSFTTAMKARGYESKPAKTEDGVLARHYLGVKLRVHKAFLGDRLTDVLRNSISTQIPQI